MRIFDRRIDVAAAAGLADAELAVSLHLPDFVPDGGKLELLFCIHGGGYDRRYWHAAFAGYPGYSFAEHFSARGRGVVAVDLLGMGDSARPEPETQLSRAKVAGANHHALRMIVADFLNGSLARASRVIVTGVGHSIGGMIAITQQEAHQSFHRLAVLGWANEPMLLGETDPATLAATIRPGYLITPRAAMRPLFYGTDVPLGLIEADEAIGSPTPACLGRDALRPGIVHEAAAAVTCPVLLLQGSTDTSSNPRGEPGYFKGSDDISLLLPRNTAHCHNFAASRQFWWDRLDLWISSLPA